MDAIGTKRGDGESHLPAVSDDPLVDRLHWVTRHSIRLLAALMVVVILWCVADVVLVLCEKLMAPPFLLLDLSVLEPSYLYAIGVMVIALGVTYWLVSTRTEGGVDAVGRTLGVRPTVALRPPAE